jgi:hypothetical protein
MDSGGDAIRINYGAANPGRIAHPILSVCLLRDAGNRSESRRGIEAESEHADLPTGRRVKLKSPPCVLLALQDMKIRKGTFETIVTVAAEVVEDLVKIKWGKLASLLFVLKNRKIALLEAERSAPGREIAYVVQARKALD